VKEKTGEKWEAIKENEKIQGAVTNVKETAGKVAEKVGETKENLKTKVGETREKIGEKVSEKWEKAKENEKFAKVVEKTGETYEKGKEKVGAAYEKTKEKTGEVYEKAKERTTEVYEKGKEKLGDTKKKAEEIWQSGKGKIVKIKHKIGEEGWLRGNAKETLLAREDAALKWKDIKIRGAEEISVAARNEYTTAYFIEQGTLLQWSFRVQEKDIGFGVRVRKMQDFGGSVEEDILPVEKFDNADTVEGSWIADEDRTIVLVFDNKYSILRSKTVAYLVGTTKPTAEEAEGVGESAAEPAASGDAE